MSFYSTRATRNTPPLHPWDREASRFDRLAWPVWRSLLATHPAALLRKADSGSPFHAGQTKDLLAARTPARMKLAQPGWAGGEKAGPR